MKFLSAPTLVEWETTYSCNLRCKHCYTDSGKKRKGELDIKRSIQLLDEIAEAGVFRVDMGGGEPTLRKDIVKLVEHGLNNKMRVVLVSNGTQITENLAKNLKRVGLTQVQVTLHGANSKVHDEFVLVEGAFDRTIKAIKYLIREDIDVIVMTATTRMSLNQIPSLIDLLLELGAKVFRLQEIIPIGRASRYDLALTLEQRRLLYRFLSLKQKELRGILSIYYAYPTCQPLSNPAHPIFEGWKGCWVPGEFCIILANGTVVPCAMARSREYWAGNVLEDGFLNIWRNSSVFKEFRKMHNESVRGKCVRCRYNISCGGGCRFLSDRLGKKPFYPDPRCAYDPGHGVDIFEFYHGNSLEGDKSESIIG